MCKVWIVNMRRIMAVPTRQCWRIARIHSSRFFDMNSIKCVINVVNISWVARIYWKPYKKGKTIKTMNNMHNKSNQHHHKSYINEADKCVPNELTAVYVQLKRNTEIQNVHASPATVWHFFFWTHLVHLLKQVVGRRPRTKTNTNGSGRTQPTARQIHTLFSRSIILWRIVSPVRHREHCDGTEYGDIQVMYRMCAAIAIP